jgi:hypothetical protein
MGFRHILPEGPKFCCYKMRSDHMEHMPVAQKDPALWIEHLQGINLCLVAICHDDSGLDLKAGFPDPFDKKGNIFCCPV